MSDDAWRNVANFAAGGFAGMCARTVIAPIERVKIIFQTKVHQGSSGSREGYSVLVRRVVQESGGGAKGVAAFWKGNSVALLRVFPYMGVQLSSNEYFKHLLSPLATYHPRGREAQRFLAGGGAGMFAVFTTYPLDLARARMALLMEQGAVQMPSMAGTIKDVYMREGLAALYSGAGISMTGAGIYCGLKFASYDACKDLVRQYVLTDTDAMPSVVYRSVSGGLAGAVAQTFVYPFDVLRRRLQTGGAEARAKYPGTLRGFWRLYRDEGFVRGLYRGCSLNYLKTIPNTTVYLALFDWLKELIH